MSRRKMLLLAVVISAGLSFGFADQRAFASETEAGVFAVDEETNPGMEAGVEENEKSVSGIDTDESLDESEKDEVDEIVVEMDAAADFIETEADTEILTDTDTIEKVIQVFEEDSDVEEGTLLYSDENGSLYQTDDGSLYYVDASTGKSVTEKLVEISSGNYAGIYYFGSDKYAVTNKLQTVSGTIYYFGSNAKAVKNTLQTVSGGGCILLWQ